MECRVRFRLRHLVQEQPAEERDAIVLSGDANIGSALIAGGEAIPFNPGNVTFFQNVLEMNAGSRVALSLNRAPASVINDVLSDIYQTCQDGGAAFRLWK